MAVGVLIGVYVGDELPEQLFQYGMAAIILLTVAMMFWWDRQKNLVIPDNPLIQSVTGLMAGFTTMVGNLAGAFTNIYFLAMRLPKEQEGTRNLAHVEYVNSGNQNERNPGLDRVQRLPVEWGRLLGSKIQSLALWLITRKKSLLKLLLPPFSSSSL